MYMAIHRYAADAAVIESMMKRVSGEFGVVEHETIEGPVVISRASALLLRRRRPGMRPRAG